MMHGLGMPVALMAAGCGSTDFKLREIVNSSFHRARMNLRKILVLLLFVLASLTGSNGGSPKMELSFKNPQYTGGSLKNILVLALNGKAASRAEFEDELVTAITRPGVTAVQSYVFLPRPNATPIDIKDLNAVIRDQNFDGIVVARLTKVGKNTTYVPGQVYTPVPYYGTFADYYGAIYPVIYDPGYMVTEKFAQVETNSYSTVAKLDGQLIWTGTTNTFNADSTMKVIKDLVKILVQELEKQNVIVPRA
ncbi:MAG: hypothetical protein WB630_14220 [Candidatus Acidiferrales bacterium]